jgi:signal transduction histidine kinase
LSIPSDVPQVVADPDRLERVLMNLVSNALKYSARETDVWLNVTKAENEVIISVVDRGVGIAPQDLDMVFDRYFRAKDTGKTDGLGLGLYISKALIEAQGGRIWADSEPGKGSSFRFTLPLE